MYDLFKFIHIVSVIVWIGAGITFLILNVRLASLRDHAGVAALAGQSEWFGRRIFSASAITTLVAGIAAVLLSDGAWGFGDFWVSYGFVGIAVSIVLGAVLSQRAGNEMAAVIAAEGPDAPRIPELQRRLNMVGAIDLLVLTSVVAAMVFKPGS